MKFIKSTLAALGALVIASQMALAQQKPAGTDTIIVLPFENRSNDPDFNWVGESFALSLSDLLNVPGLNVVSNSERKAVQQRLRIPLTNIPSLASSLRLARESGATLLVSGRYNIVPAQEETAATINVTARIIRVTEGRFLSEVLDGRQIQRDIALNDALGNLQTMQGQIAYQVLYQRDKALPFSQNQLIESANKVPARAFEAYIKGLLTTQPETRENFLKNAVRLYAESGADGSFSDASLELGHLYLGQRKHSEAVESFERVINTNQLCREKAKGENRISRCNDEAFAEASLFIGVIRWQQGNLEQALGVLRPLAEDLRMTSVYNMLGAIAVQASRDEKKDKARAAALLNEGLEVLRRTSESDEGNNRVRFNYSMALFLHGNFAEAAGQLRSLIADSPRDGDAYYLLSKALAEIKDPAAAEVDNQARMHLSAGNRYATLERDWQRTKTLPEMGLRVDPPHRRELVSVVLGRKDTTEPARSAANATDALLAQARTHFKNGNDDEAMAVLRRVLVSEPMSAESYLILGKIHLRRGDRDQAVSAFRTAIFWDNRQIDAHIGLGRIYLERGDCLQVKTFAASAIEIDPANPEATSLQRQAERCSK